MFLRISVPFLFSPSPLLTPMLLLQRQGPGMHSCTALQQRSAHCSRWESQTAAAVFPSPWASVAQLVRPHPRPPGAAFTTYNLKCSIQGVLNQRQKPPAPPEQVEDARKAVLSTLTPMLLDHPGLSLSAPGPLQDLEPTFLRGPPAECQSGVNAHGVPGGYASMLCENIMARLDMAGLQEVTRLNSYTIQITSPNGVRVVVKVRGARAGRGPLLDTQVKSSRCRCSPQYMPHTLIRIRTCCCMPADYLAAVTHLPLPFCCMSAGSC